jgi:hypothetical protein
MDDDHGSVPAPARTGTYYPDEIILYGIKLNRRHTHGNFFAGRGYELHVQLYDDNGNLLNSGRYSAVLAYGYAFEGHCYRFDKVRTFIVTTAVDEDPVGCGFDLEPRTKEPVETVLTPNPTLNPTPVYRMWRIRAADELLELTTALDSAQRLVLDANLPGRRSPTTYSVTAQVAHRGGRLNRE